MAAKELLAKINAWDVQMVQRKSQAYDDVINFENGLTAEYFFLKGQADSNIPNMTTPMYERHRELESLWLERKAIFDQIWNEDIPAVEQLLSNAGVGILR